MAMDIFVWNDLRKEPTGPCVFAPFSHTHTHMIHYIYVHSIYVHTSVGICIYIIIIYVYASGLACSHFQKVASVKPHHCQKGCYLATWVARLISAASFPEATGSQSKVDWDTHLVIKRGNVKSIWYFVNHRMVNTGLIIQC